MVSEKEIIAKVKQKKEFCGIPDEVVLDSLSEYLAKNKINSENMRSADVKIISKEIRANLRKLSGQYQRSRKNRTKLLNEGKIEALLSTHFSTSERMKFYPKLKNIIKKISPRSIVDLGCGLNPLALAEKNYIYRAYDIRGDEIELIKEFFRKNKIKGNAEVYDLRKFDGDLPSADLCLLFKVLDLIDSKNHSLARKIIFEMKCKNFLVSFPKIKLSGERMKSSERYWLENMLAEKSMRFLRFESDNEIFYFFPLKEKQKKF